MLPNHACSLMYLNIIFIKVDVVHVVVPVGVLTVGAWMVNIVSTCKTVEELISFCEDVGMCRFAHLIVGLCECLIQIVLPRSLTLTLAR